MIALTLAEVTLDTTAMLDPLAVRLGRNRLALVGEQALHGGSSR